MDFINLYPYDFQILQLGTTPSSLDTSKLTPADAPPASACTIAVIGSGTAYYRVDGGTPEVGVGIPLNLSHGIRWIGDINALRQFKAVGSGGVSLAVTYYH